MIFVICILENIVTHFEIILQKLILLNELIFDYGFQYTERTNEVAFEFFERKAIGKFVNKCQFLLFSPSFKKFIFF